MPGISLVGACWLPKAARVKGLEDVSPLKAGGAMETVPLQLGSTVEAPDKHSPDLRSTSASSSSSRRVKVRKRLHFNDFRLLVRRANTPWRPEQDVKVLRRRFSWLRSRFIGHGPWWGQALALPTLLLRVQVSASPPRGCGDSSGALPGRQRPLSRSPRVPRQTIWRSRLARLGAPALLGGGDLWTPLGRAPSKPWKPKHFCQVVVHRLILQKCRWSCCNVLIQRHTVTYCQFGFNVPRQGFTCRQLASPSFCMRRSSSP